MTYGPNFSPETQIYEGRSNVDIRKPYSMSELSTHFYYELTVRMVLGWSTNQKCISQQNKQNQDLLDDPKPDGW